MNEDKELWRKYYSKNSVNHNTNEINYGHFSSIHENDNVIYPLLKFATPIVINISAGESLIIPKYWWHWIKSTETTVAINFWSETDFETKFPEKINSTYQNKSLADKILSFDKPVTVYSKKDSQVEYKNLYFSEIDHDLNNYVYTVPYFIGNDRVHFNDELRNYISDSVNIPDIIKSDDTQYNIWITTGNHDVGLHYDDNDNILSVLKGTKNIILYPPSDSKYLYPYSIIPEWASKKAIKFDYNMYINLGELENSFPSSRLLYELIICYKNKKMLQIIKNVISEIGNNKLIYGCKIHDGVFRFELYVYAHSKLNIDLLDYQIYINDNFKDYITKNNNIVIRSFDFYDTKECHGDSTHFYHNTNLKFEFPFYGYGSALHKNDVIKESVYMLDTSENAKNDIHEIVNRLNFENCDTDILLKILNLYECEYISIHNKFTDQYYVQYLGITCKDFINFVQEHHYPEQFIKHVIENEKNYENLKHEITIVFDLDGTLVRSAFYGLL